MEDLFLPLYSNKVLRRAPGINPVNFKEHTYELEKITTYQGREVYIINVQNRDSTTKTKLYIDRQSLAYIKFEIERQQKRVVANFKQNATKEQLLFENKDSTWFLKHDRLEMYGTVGEENAKVLLEFVTNKYESDSVEQFAYNEQFLIADVIADQTNDFSDSFFEGYDMGLEQTKGLKNQIQLAFDTNILDSLKRDNPTDIKALPDSYQTAHKLTLFNILIRLTSGIGLSVAPVASENTPFSMVLTDILPETYAITSTTKATKLPLIFNFSLAFKVTRRWHFLFQDQTSLRSRTRIKTREAGVAYRLVANKAKKPIFIEPHVYYSQSEQGVGFGSFKNPVKRFDVDGIKFNANHIHTRLLTKTQGIKAGVSVSTYSRRLSKLFLQVDYLLPLQTKDPYVQLQEASFWGYLWGSNRRINVPINDARVTLPPAQIPHLPALKSPWWLGLTWHRAI